MPLPPYKVEPLEKRHDRQAFNSESQALNRYLQQQARQDVDNRVAAAFVAVDGSAPQILGYYTLSAALITTSDLPADLAKKLPRYPNLPVTRLGRLAVDQRWKGRGLGEFLLMDALSRSLTAAVEIAAMAVLVDAKDEQAAAFYRHFDFMPLQAQPLRLFLPMKTVASLFE